MSKRKAEHPMAIAVDQRGRAIHEVARALSSLDADARRRVLVACLVLIGEPVPLDYIDMESE